MEFSFEYYHRGLGWLTMRLGLQHEHYCVALRWAKGSPSIQKLRYNEDIKTDFILCSVSSSSSNVKSGHISKELVILIWYKDMKVWTILTNEGVLSVCHWIGAGVLSTGGAIIRSYFQLISESHKLPPSFHPITRLHSDNHPITERDNFSLHTCRH